MVCLARLMSTIYPGFVFRVFHLLLGRLPSKADEFYLPKANGLKAPDIRLSPVLYLQKQSLPRVGHTSDLSVRMLYSVDLGVTIDDKLIFSRHIQIQVNTANNAVGLIRHAFKYLDKESFLYLYKSLVRPHSLWRHCTVHTCFV